MLRERFTKFDDAGWHCSFFRCVLQAFAFVCEFSRAHFVLCDFYGCCSGTEGVIAKIEAFAHQEFNNDGAHPSFRAHFLSNLQPHNASN